MLYGKIPVALLSAMASEKNHSTNSVIAAYMLTHRKELPHMKIQQLAAACHVSVSSVSRFCREIGLQDFSELHEPTAPGLDRFAVASHKSDFTGRTADFAISQARAIHQAALSLEERKVMALCKKLHDTPKVAVFALLKAQAAALCLQSDLWMLGRPVYSHISFQQQQEYLNTCPSDSLLVVFSYTGSYFSYFPPLPPRDKRPFVAMIAGTPHPKKDLPCPEADLYVPFASSRQALHHPWQLLSVAGVIAQEYAHLYGAPEHFPNLEKTSES